MPLVGVPSMLTMTSFDCTPARDAGVPSIGDTTINSLVTLSRLIWIPTPINSPEVSIRISLNSLGSRKRV